MTEETGGAPNVNKSTRQENSTIVSVYQYILKIILNKQKKNRLIVSIYQNILLTSFSNETSKTIYCYALLNRALKYLKRSKK